MQETGVDYRLFIPEYSLTAYDTDHDGRLTENELSSQQAQIEQELRAHLQLQQDMTDMEFSFRGWQRTEKESIPGVSFSLYYTSAQPISGFTIQYNLLFDDADPNHLNFAVILDGDDADQTIFDAQHRTYRYQSLHPATALTTVWRYFVLGIEHILTGYDHLLFLFSLLLIAVRYMDMLRIVTAFTVAHSITLIAASTGWIHPSSNWVEAGIAATICYVALENIWSSRHEQRWLVTFVFGLIHGMGFAGALGEIGLPPFAFASSLLTFNLGVETGQLAVVAAVMPILLWLRKKAGYRALVIYGSAAIFLQALWWLLERIGLLPG
ncbi:HupE/UreJ family protein [Paenibacillus doosanensis]|uniref:HupE/UreJ family protein n=1 Tax=Paenibacillus doosanensis TaxID=1229154 RepID=UPI0021800DC6|nr:HupE/UreJ family protein [Paenibacillus doosanensis]MCS7461388.1 HupE/UreJ family protein [Paenibacillus doosanensis]